MTAADDRARFLDVLFPSQLGRMEFRPLPSGRHLFVAHGDRAAVEDVVRTCDGREDVYVGVAARGPADSGTIDNCVALDVVFVDIDWKTTAEPEVRRRLAEFPFAPTMLVQSGGGVHVYWGLVEPLVLPADEPRARRLLRGLAVKFGGDLPAAEPARILRPPGTRNRKYAPPRRVGLALCAPERRYVADDLAEFLPIAEAPAGAGSGFVVPDRLPEGGRATALYQLARSLKTKGLTREEILAAVAAVNRERCAPPLGDDEVMRQVDKAMRQPDRSGYGPRTWYGHPGEYDGRETEVSPPEDEPPAGEDPAPGSPRDDASGESSSGGRRGPRRLVAPLVSELKDQAIDWIWRRRLPAGKLVIVAGDPGLGKSFVVTDLHARLSTGLAWPDEATRRAPVPSIILSAEDGAEDTIRPRLLEQGADPERIRVVKGVETRQGLDTFSLDVDLALLEALSTEMGARVVSVDPLNAYLPVRDSFKDSDIRRALMPLGSFADRTGIVVVAVMHLSKDRDRQAIYRILGGVGYAASARVVLMVCKDPEAPDTRRYFVSPKNNLSRPALPLAFAIEELPADRGRLVWEGPVEGLDVEALVRGVLPKDATADDASARQDARDFLRELLGEATEWAAAVHLAAGQNGIARSTLFRAKRDLRVWACKTGGADAVGQPGQQHAAWYWWMPGTVRIPPTTPPPAGRGYASQVRRNSSARSKPQAPLAKGSAGSVPSDLGGVTGSTAEPAWITDRDSSADDPRNEEDLP